MKRTIKLHRTIRIRKYKPDWYCIFLSIIWAKDILSGYVRALFMRLPLLRIGNGYPALTVIYMVALLLALPRLIRYIQGKHLFFPLFVGSIYGLTYLIYPENSFYLDRYASTFFLTVLPMYFLGLIWDVDDVVDTLYRVSVVAVVCSMLYNIFISGGMDQIQSRYEGSMSHAYELLPHLCLVGYYALNRTSVFNMMLSAAGVMYLLSLGTRGAVLCLIVFYLLVVFMLTRTRRKTAIILAGSAACGVLMTGNILYFVLGFLEQFFRRMGLSVRVVEKFLQGSFWESRGRNVIRLTLMEALENRPFLGFGLFGDRVIADFYAHNIILEFFIDFGIVTGIVLLVAIVILIIGKYFTCRSRDQRAFLLLLVCSSILHLMFSGSYLTEPYFFLLCGFCVSKVKPTRKKYDGGHDVCNSDS